MRNIAIILAGGIGSRLNKTLPKQLLPLANGQTIIEQTVDAFQQAPDIHEIAIVMHPHYLHTAQEMKKRNHWTKVQKILKGGKERWESSLHAIQTYTQEEHPEEINLLLHDAARPFVSQHIIHEVCQALRTHEAITVAIPATDTIYQINPNNNTLQNIPPRQNIMYAQTPQAFRLTLLQKAYNKAIEQAISSTDDCGIIHQQLPNTPIHIVLGDAANRKITYIEDLNTPLINNQ